MKRILSCLAQKDHHLAQTKYSNKILCHEFICDARYEYMASNILFRADIKF